MENIKNIIFDLGGVLVHIDLDRCIATFKELGMPRIAALINPYHPAEMIGRMEHGDISFHQMCDQMRSYEGRDDVTDEQISYAYSCFLQGIPIEKMRQIEQLRQKGYRTYVLSNNNPDSMRYIRQMFTADGNTIDHYFDKLYLSYEMKLLKPSGEIFRAMASDAGMIPAESLFIDDSQTNVDAARAEGFCAVLSPSNDDYTPQIADLL